jgi:hypothetical protein
MAFGVRRVVFATSVAVALTASCRSVPEPCRDDCASGAGGAPAESGQGGGGSISFEVPPEGGAPAAGHPGVSPLGGEGGDALAKNDGGAAGEPDTARAECTSDADCDDGKACDGPEQCQDGHCEAGRAFECSSISECFERGSGAACRYSASERFVVYTGDEFGDEWGNAVAVPITRLDEPVALNFSEGAMDDEFNSIFEYDWSPDGRRLIFAASTSDFINDVWDQKFFWFDVTAALDGQPRRLPNVPINDSFSVLAWSPSSNAVVIGYEAEQFAVRFTASGAETAAVPTVGYVEPCGDDATVAYSTADGTHLAAVWDAPDEETVLPATLRSRSPDGRWLLLSDEQHAFLARCSLDSKLEELGGPAGVTSGWSSNSEYVVYSDTDMNWSEDATPKALSAFRVESSAEHVALFEAIAADPTVNFEPGSTRFLYVAQTRERRFIYRLVDLAQPASSVPLPLPAGIGDPSLNYILAYTVWLGKSGRLAFETNDGPDTYVMEAASNAVPRLVREDSYDDLLFSEDGTKAIWIESGGDGAGALSQAFTLDLTRSDSEPHPLFAEPLTGELSLYAAQIIRRFIPDPTIRHELFAVPPDFASEPVRINTGTIAAEPALQPRP